MDDLDRSGPHSGARAAAAQAERAAREAAALRENLRRRKAQARARADSTTPTAETGQAERAQPDEIG